jgi:hypothetical protein
VWQRTALPASQGHTSGMKNKLLRGAILATLGGSCLAASPLHAGMLSATRPVIAILDGELFVGVAEGQLDGSGTLAIHSQKTPSVTCQGEFTSSAKLGGAGTLRCTDGGSATFSFKRLNVFRGHGTGTTSRGSMSFVYGLSVAESTPYLKLPGGKKFGDDGNELKLVEE